MWYDWGMTTLSIDPTSEDLVKIAQASGSLLPDPAEGPSRVRHALFQAGVEAERARVAAEVAETNDDPHVAALQYQAGWEAGIEAERARVASEMQERVEWAANDTWTVEEFTSEEAAQTYADRRLAFGFQQVTLLRRTVLVGPWQVH